MITNDERRELVGPFDDEPATDLARAALAGMHHEE
jgi:hypothetical protein